MPGLRAKKSNKRRKTNDKYGKYTKKSMRIRIVQEENAEANSKHKSQQQTNIAPKNRNTNNKR